MCMVFVYTITAYRQSEYINLRLKISTIIGDQSLKMNNFAS